VSYASAATLGVFYLSTFNANRNVRFVFGDFETYYASDYSLRHMDPPSYILDPRFEAICLGVCDGFTSAPYLVDGPDIPRFLKDIGTDVAFVSHNALFDASILSWRYDWVPKLICDTLGMSRSLLGARLKSLSLKSVGEYFGLVKGDEVMKVMGMSRADIIANGMWNAYGSYCMNDTAICRAIFAQLAPLLPPEELILHDMVLRCAVEPAFKADVGVLHQNLSEVQSNKERLFIRAMFAGLHDRAELMSNEQFADLLRRLGVTVPLKVSKTTGRTTYAFSKTDQNFLALLEDDDPRVVALVEARLAFKTTIEETRTKRMINIAGLTFGGKGSGWMPIPLKIGAAHTHRLGGDWKLNPQNWGRKSLLRKAVEAPEGYKVVAVDSAQIEARLNAWFCGQWDLVEQFARGEDVYSNFASDIYHVPVDKKTEPSKRFVGKTGILQLGYQSGADKFRSTVWLLSFNTEPQPIDLSPEEATSIVAGYRQRYSSISGMWRRLEQYIRLMATPPRDGNEVFYELGPLKFGYQRIIGPGGLQIEYHNLRYMDGSEWVYDYGGIPHKLYGGKLLENIIQFLARIVVMQAAVRLRKPLAAYKTRLCHTAHDEIVYVVPDEHVGVVSDMVKHEMCVCPTWAAGLPLAAEVGVGQNYGECK